MLLFDGFYRLSYYDVMCIQFGWACTPYSYISQVSPPSG